MKGLQRVITRRQKTYKVKPYLGVTTVMGKVIPSWGAEVDTKLLILPIKLSDLNAYPEGAITTQDIIIHQVVDTPLKERDKVVYKNIDYEVMHLADRTDYGGFYMCIGKKENGR